MLARRQGVWVRGVWIYSISFVVVEVAGSSTSMSMVSSLSLAVVECRERGVCIDVEWLKPGIEVILRALASVRTSAFS